MNENENLQENRTEEKAPKKKKAVIICLTAAILLILCAGSLLAYRFYLKPNSDYSEAGKKFEAGEYAEALKIYEELKQYKDSADKAQECRDKMAEEEKAEQQRLAEAEKEAQELALFEQQRLAKQKLAEDEQAEQAEQEKRHRENYEKALAFVEKKDYKSAIWIFEMLEDYRDSETQKENCLECIYTDAMDAYSQKDYNRAEELFGFLGEYKDSADRIILTRILAGVMREDAEVSMYSVRDIFSYAPKEEWEKLEEELYQKAADDYAAGRFLSAAVLFEGLAEKDVKDSEEREREAEYAYALECRKNGNPKEAGAYFLRLDDYRDSKEQAYLCAVQMRKEDNMDCYSIFHLLDDYKDSQKLYKECYVEWIYRTAKKQYEDREFLYIAYEFTNNDDYAAYADYKDLKELRYLSSKNCQESGLFDAAACGFKGLGDYKDSKELYLKNAIDNIRADMEKNAAEEDDLMLFVSPFLSMKDLPDGKEKSALEKELSEKAFRIFSERVQSGTYKEAPACLLFLSDFSLLTEEEWYRWGTELLNSDGPTFKYPYGTYFEAEKVFRSLGNYEDAKKYAEYAVIKELIDEQDCMNQDDCFPVSPFDEKYELALKKANELSGFLDVEEIAAGLKYHKARYYENIGVYQNTFDKALALYAELPAEWAAEDRVTVAERIALTKYKKARYLADKGRYDEAIKLFEEVKDDIDNAEKRIAETRCFKACAAGVSSEEDEASLNRKCLEEIAAIREANPGDTVSFGNYFGESEWILLKKKNGLALLVMNQSIDDRRADEYTHTTWGQSVIREWLNSSFLNAAFSKAERTRIVEKKLTNENFGYGFADLPEFEKTMDKVFLLEDADLRRYKEEEGLPIYPSNYDWLVRDASAYPDAFLRSSFSGEIDREAFGVCPAVWVDISE